MAEHHELIGGKLHVYKRENSRFWQCSAYLAGKNRRMTTKEESLSHAKEIAEDWYLELRGKARAGGLTSGPTFKKAADQFLEEYELITQGQRSPLWVKTYEWMLRVYLLPFFGKLALSEITAGKVQDYRCYWTSWQPFFPEDCQHQRSLSLEQSIHCRRYFLLSIYLN